MSRNSFTEEAAGGGVLATREHGVRNCCNRSLAPSDNPIGGQPRTSEDNQETARWERVRVTMRLLRPSHIGIFLRGVRRPRGRSFLDRLPCPVLQITCPRRRVFSARAPPGGGAPPCPLALQLVSERITGVSQPRARRRALPGTKIRRRIGQIFVGQDASGGEPSMRQTRDRFDRRRNRASPTWPTTHDRGPPPPPPAIASYRHDHRRGRGIRR